jgi:hypothetical protein
MLSTLDLWPYSSREGVNIAVGLASDLSTKFHIRIVRSLPEDTTFVGERNFTAFTEAVCPFCAAGGEVARREVSVVFHTRINPSKAPESMRDELDSEDRTSTELTQSSCSMEEMCTGGIKARTYSTLSVVSAEMAFAVRNSSIVVRRNWPFMRNSKGMGFSDSRRLLTRVERAYRRRATLLNRRIRS